MGVLNVTPDSFSDGGHFYDLDAASRQADRMTAAGVSIIDIGGESTRPGSAGVEQAEELDRVVPVIEALRQASDIPISIDTSKPIVMREAVSAGAAMINDVLALQSSESRETVADLKVPVCLMHMLGMPRTMQANPHYENVVEDVTEFLRARVAECVESGIDRSMIAVDPGFGFGKSSEHNIELLANLRQLHGIDVPVLVGLSRKKTLGDLTDKAIDERLPASVAAAVIAAMKGAHIVRVHDVGETVDAMQIVKAVLEAK